MKVSIITVTHNSAATIANCIASVFNQSYPNIEHIIIDGASKDDTVEIIKALPNRVTKIISEPDNGIYDAINKGIHLATGDVIGVLSSNDQFFNLQSVETIVHGFENPEIDATYGNLILHNKHGKTIRVWKSRPYKPGLFAHSWTPAHPTFYCKREIYERHGLYRTDYRIAADVELMLRFIAIHKIKTNFINENLVKMLVGGTSTQGIKSTLIIIKEMKRAFKENKWKFNIAKYLIFKVLKVREFIFKS